MYRKITIRKTTKTYREWERKRSQKRRRRIKLVPFHASCTICYDAILIQLRRENIISSLGKLLPHQWRKLYAKLSLSFPLCIVYSARLGHKIFFYFSVPNIWVSFQFSLIALRAIRSIHTAIRFCVRRVCVCDVYSCCYTLRDGSPYSQWINLIFLCCSI